MKATTPYVITPNYNYGVELAQWQIVRTKDDAILRSLDLNNDNLNYLIGYADGMGYEYVIQ